MNPIQKHIPLIAVSIVILWSAISIVSQLLPIQGSQLAQVISSVQKYYYVDYGSGSDANDGLSANTPWKHSPGDPRATDRAAIVLSPGDAVVFKGGTTYSFSTSTVDYIDANASGSQSAPITYMSGDLLSPAWGSGRAVIDGTYADPSYSAHLGVISLKNFDYIVIKGLEIKNLPQTQAFNTVGLIGWSGTTGGHITIDNNIIHDSGAMGVLLQGEFGSNSPNPGGAVIVNNKIYRTNYHNMMLRWGWHDVAIENNSFDLPGVPIYTWSSGSPLGDNLDLAEDGTGTGSTQVNIIIRNNIFDNTAIQNGFTPTKSHILIADTQNNLTIERNIFRGQPQVASLDFIAQVNGLHVRNNIFNVYPTTYEGIIRFYTDLGNIPPSTDLNFENNTFVSTPKYSGIFYFATGNNTNPPPLFKRVSIVNNIIDTDSNGAPLIDIRNQTVELTSFKTNNNVYNAGTFSKPFLLNGTQYTFDGWKTYLQSQGVVGADQNSGVGAVAFTNRSAKDFHLGSSDSLALDRGTSLTTFANDKDGSSRPQGNAWDIGAFESPYSASVALTPTPSVTSSTYYVDPENGSDSNDGTTQATAWKNLPGTVGVTGSGWKVLQDGNTVYVKGGSINSVQVKIGSKWYNGSAKYDSIKIVGGQYASPAWGSGMPVFDEQSTRTFGFWIGAGSATKGITIDGLEIKNIAAGAVGTGFDTVSGSATIDIGGAYVPSYITVRRSYLHDALRNLDDQGHGIEMGGGDHFIIEDNTIGPNIGLKGIEAPAGTNWGIVRNNYLTDFQEHGIVISGNRWDVYNNVVNMVAPFNKETVSGIKTDGAASDSASYNDVWNNIIFYQPPSPFSSLINGTNGLQAIGRSDGVSTPGNRFYHNTIYNMDDYPNGGKSGTCITIGGENTLSDNTDVQNNIGYHCHNLDDNQFWMYGATSNNVIKYNDFYYQSTTGKIAVVRIDTGPLFYTSEEFNSATLPNGSSANNNTEVAPVFVGGTLPSGLNSNYTPNTDYFKLSSATAPSVITTGNVLQGDSSHGYSSDPNKFSYDILGNKRSNWSMGAYEYTSTTVSSTPTPTPAPAGDTTAPTITITQPLNGETWTTGRLTITANATDNVGIAGVTFYINNQQLGSEITTSPYRINWRATVGTYTITAKARDTSNNTKLSAPVTVTIVQSTSVKGRK